MRKLIKPGDLVRTPTGRTARVVGEPRYDGRRDLEYIDQGGGEVTLHPATLTLVVEGPIVPWKSRLPGGR